MSPDLNATLQAGALPQDLADGCGPWTPSTDAEHGSAASDGPSAASDAGRPGAGPGPSAGSDPRPGASGAGSASPTWSELAHAIPPDTEAAALGLALPAIFQLVAALHVVERDAALTALVARFTHLTKRTANMMLKEALGAHHRRQQRQSGSPAGEGRAAGSLGRPQIVVNEGHLRDMIDGAWGAVRGDPDAPELFSRGREVVRVVRHSPDDAYELQVMGPAQFYGAIIRRADCMQRTASGVLVPATPNYGIAQDMAANPPSDLPPLKHLVHIPVFDRRGNLLATEGYHAEAATWVDLPASFTLLPVPSLPSVAEVSEAVWMIRDDLLGDFPFARASDVAHMIGFLIQPFVRGMIKGPTPGLLIEAPTPGTGKSLLAEILSAVATGGPGPMTSLDGTEDAFAKTILSLLREGPAIIVLDNLPSRSLYYSTLASVLTAMEFKARVLGVSETASPPIDTTWVFTGNNPRMSSEILRRLVQCRLDPARATRPAGAPFRHPRVREWALEHRGALVRAILTLVQNWIVKGRPSGDAQELASFEDWTASALAKPDHPPPVKPDPPRDRDPGPRGGWGPARRGPPESRVWHSGAIRGAGGGAA